MLTGSIIAPSRARADITYTWVEDDGYNVSCKLVVNSAAQTNGQITLSDVVSFSFSTPQASWTSLDELDPSTIPISMSNAAPTGTDDSLVTKSAEVGGMTYFASISLDEYWNASFGELAVVTKIGGELTPYSGHWTISGASAPPTSSAPEPSTAVVASVGTFAFMDYAWARGRRSERRQSTARV